MTGQQQLLHELARVCFEAGIAHGKGAKNDWSTDGKALDIIDRITGPQPSKTVAIQPDKVGAAPSTYDAAGTPKLKMTILESLGVNCANDVKAWADSHAPGTENVPADILMGLDMVLMFAAQRRAGVA